MNLVARAAVVACLFASSSARAEEGLRFYFQRNPPGLAAASQQDEVWLGPSVGIDAFTVNFATREYRVGLIPGVGLGVKWQPQWSWWKKAKIGSAFLAGDLFVQAALGANTAAGSPGTFNIDILPVVTLMDWIGIGVGYRIAIPLAADAPNSSGILFSFGLRKAT